MVVIPPVRYLTISVLFVSSFSLATKTISAGDFSPLCVSSADSAV